MKHTIFSAPYNNSSDDTSYAYSLFPTHHWKLADVIAITSTTEKHISFTDGHKLAKSSPLFKAGIPTMLEKIFVIKTAFKQKNFSVFGKA